MGLVPGRGSGRSSPLLRRLNRVCAHVVRTADATEPVNDTVGGDSALSELDSPVDLATEQVAQYKRSGFLVLPGFINSASVRCLVQTLDTITKGSTLGEHDRRVLEMEPEQSDSGRLVRRIYEPCGRYQTFRNFAESPMLLSAVSQLLGSRDLVYHYSKVNMKPPRVDTTVDWHQDLSYYPLTNRSSVAVLLYLDDADERNGALRVIARDQSLLDGMLSHNSPDGFFQGRIPSLGTPDGADSPSDQIVLEAPAGSCIFLGGLTPHASAANHSERYRRTLIISYRTADNFPLYLSGERYTTEKSVRLVSGKESLIARMEAGVPSIPVPRYRHSAESIFEIQGRSRRGEA